MVCSVGVARCSIWFALRCETRYLHGARAKSRLQAAQLQLYSYDGSQGCTVRPFGAARVCSLWVVLGCEGGACIGLRAEISCKLE